MPVAAAFDFPESVEVSVPRGSALQVPSGQASDGSINVDQQVIRQSTFSSAPDLVLHVCAREVSVGGGSDPLEARGTLTEYLHEFLSRCLANCKPLGCPSETQCHSPYPNDAHQSEARNALESASSSVRMMVPPT